MITLYGMSSSGNCYKLQLACAQLGIEHAWEEIDVTRGENLSPDFLALNDRGKVPVLRLDEGRTLCESNAILNYLAQGTRLLPNDPWDRAKTLQWMFFESPTSRCSPIPTWPMKPASTSAPTRGSNAGSST